MFTFFLHSIFLLLLVFLLKRYYRGEPLQKFFTWGFLAKIAAGTVFTWIYLHYYGKGDMQNYFQYASSLSNIFYEDFNSYIDILFFDKYTPIPNFNPELWIQTRALFFMKLLSICNIFSGGNFWVLTNYLSFFSFLGMWNLANVLSKIFPRTKYAALLGFVFLPSMLIWSVGIMKESLIMGILGFALARLLLLKFKPNRTSTWWILSILIWFVSSILLLFIKFYYLAVLLPCILAYLLTDFISRKINIFKNLVLQFSLFIILIVILYYPISFTNKYLALENVMWDVCYNHNITYVFSKQNDLIHYWRINNAGFITLSPTIDNFAINSPIALYSGLFRPFLWEADNKLKLILSFENLIVLSLSIFALYFWIRKGKKQYNLMILACLFYICALCIILAFSSPNFGTLSRYKVGFTPVLVYLISIPLSLYWGDFLDKKLKRIL